MAEVVVRWAGNGELFCVEIRKGLLSNWIPAQDLSLEISKEA